MPGKIKVKVLAGRNLPVMDRASDTTDAFVEIKFGNVTHKTDVCRKSLNPHWNSTEWYRFEVDESELQDEPLQLRLMDHDTYSANDAIGKVVISLAPLLAREANNTNGVACPPSGAVMSGWIPVFDTMHGIRGELNVIVKVELFSDFNKYKTSSCGVQFFHCPMIPPGYKATAIHGFVEELVVNDDPEYQWIDKIRTPRASNEARQVAFIKLSNQVQRLVGLKAAELGANAVVGYQQNFDLEGEAGVVARAIGTAVSIKLLPSLGQTLNIPPCTQQQLKKYLDILAIDSESIVDLNQYFQNHQDELQNFLNILNPKTPSLLDEAEIADDDEKSCDLTRQSSIKSYAGSISIYQDDYISQKSLRHLSEDQTDLNKLLKGNNDSDSESSGPLQKIKKIKTNFFSKRFGSMRSRKPDNQDDQISLQSNSSDTSRMSLNDIKNELKKMKRIKKPKFRKVCSNKEDEGIGMASILARSVIHAHTSLACIAETQDSEHSPNSTMRRTSESEPTMNVSDEDKSRPKSSDVVPVSKNQQNRYSRPVPEIHTSLKNINVIDETSRNPQRKLSESCPATPMAVRSENLLKLPEETCYCGTASLSGESSEIYSSSEEDDESSDQKTDYERSVETTSSVVQSVLNHGVNAKFFEQTSTSHGFHYKVSLEPSEVGQQQNTQERQIHIQYNSESSEYTSSEQEIESNTEVSMSPEKKNKARVATKSNTSLHLKFHNPFGHKKVSKSVSAPSSPVEKIGFVNRSSKKIKYQLSKFSKSSLIKSLSHYSLLPKKKQIESKITLSQPGSTSDVPSKAPSHETVLGSPFLSFADLLTLDKENKESNKLQFYEEINNPKVTMYIGSEPVSRSSLSGPCPMQFKDEDHHCANKLFKREKLDIKPTGLVHTAMETILMDKVQSLLVPSSPEPNASKERQFFDDVNEKLEQVKEARNRQNLNWSELSLHPVIICKEKHKKHNLIHTAIETILMDKVQSLLIPTTPDATHIDKSFFDDKHPDIEVNKSAPNEDLNVKHQQEIYRVVDFPEENKNLVNAALKTILIDKVDSLVPTFDEPLNTSEKNVNFQTEKNEIAVQPQENNSNKTSLFHSAMETILMDKVQSLVPTRYELIAVQEKQPDDNMIHASDTIEETTSHGLFHTAMETILIDKVVSLVPGSSAFDIQGQFSDKSISHAVLETNKQQISESIPPVIVGFQEKPGHVELCKSEEPTILSCDNSSVVCNKENKRSNLTSTIVKGIHVVTSQPSAAAIKHDLVEKVKIDGKNNGKKDKKLVRQDSIHSIPELKNDSHKMSKESIANDVTPCKVTQIKPVLQHFHPILSGPPLETIPSLPEGSLDHTESLDIEGVEEKSCQRSPECNCLDCLSETNNASVCDNSHAACRFDRSDREKDNSEKDRGSPRHARHESYGGREPVSVATTPLLQTSPLNSASIPVSIHRRSSDSDLSVTPKGSSLNTSTGIVGSGGGAILRSSMNSNNLEMLEYPFLTMTDYPPGLIVHIGGTVCSRSVKLVDGGGESATRAAWWAELRTELRAHARALRCNAVIAYTELAAICEDVCVLSASGTAAVINLDCDFNSDDTSLTTVTSGSKTTVDEMEPETCTVAHVPYSPGAGPYRAELSTCGGCGKARVPAVLLATCGKPNNLASYTKAVTLTAVATRVRRAPPAAEPGARDISDQLPFLEYDLYKLLLAKLRMQGANALFSLQTQIAIGERCVMALASGIAVKLTALPPPTPPRIKATENEKDAVELQKALWDSFTANKTANGYDIGTEYPSNGVLPDPEVDESTAPPLDLCVDKDACFLELDEAEDVETARSLAARRVLMQVYTNGLRAAPSAPPQAFAQVWRARLTLSGQGGGASTAAERHVARALDGVTYKLRRLQPCALVAPRFQLELPEDEIQLVVSGAAIQLADPNKPEHNVPVETTHTAQGVGFAGNHGNGTGDADDDIFTLDEEQVVKQSQPSEVPEDRNATNGQPPTMVSLTSLSYVNGSRAVRRVCALRLLFVRETTAVRELGGLSGFLHTFTCEVFAIVRAYTAALGGNALTSFYITQLMLQDNAHKNQGQCLLSVGGDVVHITY